MTQHLNLDVYVGVNLFMNYALLWMTGRLVRARLVHARLLAAAGVGTVYSLAFLMPNLAFLFSTSAKVVCSLIMVAIAFQPSRWRHLIAPSAVFFGVAFITAGSIMAMAFAWGQGAFPLRWWLLPLGLGATLGTSYTLSWYLGRDARVRPGMVEAEVFLGDARGHLTGYLDTGNCLRDPITGAPVLLAELAAVRDLLPCGAGVAMAGDPLRAMDELASTTIASRVRLIPYSTVGNPGGLLLGFRPDALVTTARGRTLVTRDVIVAVIPGDLGLGACDCLVHPELVLAEDD
ncbi:MAG: sigma-E processing peptidase SpoIIGA [Bacillota bacterium]